MRTLIFVGLFSLLTGCGAVVDDSTAINTLKAEGWTDVQIAAKHSIGPQYRGCDRHDVATFEALGTNPSGQKMEVTVCCGISKNCKIRL